MCRPTQTAPYAHVPLTAKEIRVVIWSLRRALSTLAMPQEAPDMTEAEKARVQQDKYRRIDGERQVEEMVTYLNDCLQAMDRGRTLAPAPATDRPH